MLKYIKKAFLYHWNLLAVGAGVGVSLLSGRPDIGLPLVLAGETAYLGLLATHPKYQAYVNAQEHKQTRDSDSKQSKRAIARIMRQLPRESLDRFDRLRLRCLELRDIAGNLQHSSDDTQLQDTLQEFQHEGLDRLLWVFLRLLHTQDSLGRFLKKTKVDLIHNEIERIETRLGQLDDSSTHADKLRHTLTDNLQTCKSRLDNYEKARANHEYVELEIDRLENKIKSLAELGVNRREHDFITSQVDQVAESMLDTEQTMSELDFATGGFAELDDEIPHLLKRRTKAFE